MKGLCACKGCPTRPEGVQVWWKPTQVASILTEVKVSSWILLVLGPRSPKDPTSYEKELFFSSRPSWFLGRGLNHHLIAYFKIDDLLSLCRSNYTAVPSEYHLRSADIDRFPTCEALFPARQIKGAIILSKHHYVYVYCIDLALSSVGLIISCSIGIVENKL